MKFFSASRIAFIICVSIACFSIINHDLKHPIYSNIESKIIELVAPAMKATSSATYFFSEIGEVIDRFFASAEEVKRLKEKNEFLEHYFYLYKQIKAENKIFRKELNFNRDPVYKYITAQVIGRTNNTGIQQIIIDAGENQGIKKGQFVLANNELVGRVVWLTSNSAKILLLSDQLSRIPAISINSRDKFIVAGQATNYFACKYLNEKPLLQEGELVITSGQDTSIISGIIIGSIFKEDNNFYVKPNINFDKIEFVQVLQTENNG